MSKVEIPVVIAMGSANDLSIMQEAKKALQHLSIPNRLAILSAHRTPQEVADFAQTARAEGVRVIIAGAGGAAHLPGMIAAYTELPVIGVPVPVGELQGQDALLSIVQMPKGVPVATVAIGKAWNAGILAAQILGAHPGPESQRILDQLAQYKKEMREEVLRKGASLEE